MKKYTQIHEIINQLTDSPTFKIFFTLYLMANSEDERQIISQRFWRDVEELEKKDQLLIQKEFTQCFLQLPTLVNRLSQKVFTEALV